MRTSGRLVAVSSCIEVLGPCVAQATTHPAAHTTHPRLLRRRTPHQVVATPPLPGTLPRARATLPLVRCAVCPPVYRGSFMRCRVTASDAFLARECVSSALQVVESCGVGCFSMVLVSRLPSVQRCTVRLQCTASGVRLPSRWYGWAWRSHHVLITPSCSRLRSFGGVFWLTRCCACG